MAWKDEVLDAAEKVAPDTGSIRYGVSTAEKERIARNGSLPGAPKDHSADQKKADRYASAYLFAKKWPRLSDAVGPLLDMIGTSDLPIIGGLKPEEQSQAQTARNRAKLDY